MLPFLFLAALPCRSQFTDDFSDDDFGSAPAWKSSNESGKGVDFQVVNGELQSNGPAATAKVWLSNDKVPDITQQNVTWVFKARYGSSPSSSNNTEIYLTSNSADLTATAEGYFVRLGESGSDDGIDLYKTGSAIPLIADPSPSVASGFNVNIRVTRDTGGKWTLEADTSGGLAYKVIGTANDHEFVGGAYFGIKVAHTSTKNQAFSFDDISITSSDVKAPDLTSVEVISNLQLDLLFSEDIDQQSGGDANNYWVGGDVGYPVSAEVDEANPQIVHLDFSREFSIGSVHQIQITQIQDISGNAVSSIRSEFVYFVEEPAVAKDIIITEIFADPSPPNDLPEKEFIEVYNNSDKIFDLHDWLFSDLKDTTTLYPRYFFPGDFLILCPKDAAVEFEPYGQVMGLDVWPTLNNGEDFLMIRNNHGLTIDSVHYSDRWYKSSAKSGGGWTLELIDPANLCGQNNWAASEHVSGGTPGAVNSVMSQNPDLTPPRITEVLGLQPDSIAVRFSEVLDPDIEAGDFSITSGMSVSSVRLNSNLTELGLNLAGHLQAGTSYTLKINGIRDCSGNLIDKETAVDFFLIETADSLDIVINELLFNPYSGGVDFVELYNTSLKYVNLNGWSVANADKRSGQYSAREVSPITTRDVVMEPRSYLVVTEDGTILKEHYPMSKEDRFHEVHNMPAYNDDSGIILLINQDSVLMDLLEYSEALHFALLADNEGVSLERVSFNAPTNDPHNWKSAASTTGFATPGYFNSQARKDTEKANGQIIADPKVIIPDGAGHNNFTTINYAFDRAGYVANTRIVDAYGRTVKTLGENDYLSAEGFYTWDATDDTGVKVRTGYYLICLEAFGLNGDILRFKEKVVVGTKF